MAKNNGNRIGRIAFKLGERIGSFEQSEQTTQFIREAKNRMIPLKGFTKRVLQEGWKLYTGQKIYSDMREFDERAETAFYTLIFNLVPWFGAVIALDSVGELSKEPFLLLIEVVGVGAVSLFILNQITAMGRAFWDGRNSVRQPNQNKTKEE